MGSPSWRWGWLKAMRIVMAVLQGKELVMKEGNGKERHWMLQWPTRQKELILVLRSVYNSLWREDNAITETTAWGLASRLVKKNMVFLFKSNMIIWRIIEDIGAIRTKLILYLSNCSIKL